MPAIRYFNAAGKRLCGVTTINGNLGWNRDALMFWAHKQGQAGVDLYDTQKDAMSVGTLAHLAMEADIKGEEFDLDALDLVQDQRRLVARSIEAWNRWREVSRLKLMHSECSMVSEKYQYGGTLDAIAEINGRLGVLDLKTAKGVYEDYLVQIRAYGQLWTETHPDQPIEEYHIIRVGKDNGSFHHHMWPAEELESCWKVFEHALQLHQLKRAVKGLL
jgi:hypothetical protein